MKCKKSYGQDQARSSDDCSVNFGISFALYSVARLFEVTVPAFSTLRPWATGLRVILAFATGVIHRLSTCRTLSI